MFKPLEQPMLAYPVSRLREVLTLRCSPNIVGEIASAIYALHGISDHHSRAADGAVPRLGDLMCILPRDAPGEY